MCLQNQNILFKHGFDFPRCLNFSLASIEQPGGVLQQEYNRLSMAAIPLPSLLRLQNFRQAQPPSLSLAYLKPGFEVRRMHCGFSGAKYYTRMYTAGCRKLRLKFLFYVRYVHCRLESWDGIKLENLTKLQAKSDSAGDFIIQNETSRCGTAHTVRFLWFRLHSEMRYCKISKEMSSLYFRLAVLCLFDI